MPRPQKKRIVCCLPSQSVFSPPSSCEEIVMTVDEYEAIRLIDLEGCTQEECAQQMQVSRTTVQGIYDGARHKIADALVNGKKLRISGGDYVVCHQYSTHCGRGCHKRCHKHLCQQGRTNGEG